MRLIDTAIKHCKNYIDQKCKERIIASERMNHPILYINWLITPKCNYKCTYCYAKDIMQTAVEPTLEELQRTAQSILRFTPVAVVLSGGEPFLSPYLRDIVTCLSGNTRVIIDTNGSIANQDLLEFFREKEVLLRVSLDDANTERNNLTRVGSFGGTIQTKEFIRQCIKIGVDILVQTVVTKINYPYLEELKEYLEMVGVKYWRLLPVSSSKPDNVSLGCTVDEMQRLRKNIYRYSKNGVEIAMQDDYENERSGIVLVSPDGAFLTINDAGKKFCIDPLHPQNPNEEKLELSIDWKAHYRRYMSYERRNSNMRILHISDLHFGITQDETSKVQRDNLLDSMIEIVSDKDIEFVAFSGDIVFKNLDQGYIDAEEWLRKLSTRLGIGLDHFLLCPGNHDLDRRKCTGMIYPDNREFANNVLKLENLEEISRRFQKYIDFCKRLGVAVPQFHNTDNYLNGIYVYKNVCFWVLNTAWFAFGGGERDKGKLWLGQPLLDIMIDDIYRAKRTNSIDCIISMAHHPKMWLDESEIVQYGNNLCAFDTVAKYSNINLTGHTHGNIQEPEIVMTHMYSFAGGASFIEVEHPHNFSIFEVANGDITREIYESINRKEWMPPRIKHYKALDFALHSNNVLNKVVDGHKKTTESDISKFLQDVSITSINVASADYKKEKRVIWPVIPRNTFNAIHMAELELIRVLAQKCKWSVQCLITDFSLHQMSEQDIGLFIQKIRDYCSANNVQIDFIRLNDCYTKASTKHGSSVYEAMFDIFNSIEMRELTSMNEKGYDDSIKAEMGKRKVLKYVLPLLQLAAIKTISDGLKPIIVAGNDENVQWTKFVSILGQRHLSALLIPELYVGKGKSVYQSGDEYKEVINCYSRDGVMRHAREGNVSNWYYNMFYCLPKQIIIKKGKTTNNNKEWNEIFREIELFGAAE